MAYKIKKWNLSQLFPGFDSPELNGAFDNVEEQVTSFEGARAKLKPDIDAETFLEVVRASESMTRIVNCIYAYAGLAFAEDTQNRAIQRRQVAIRAEVRPRHSHPLPARPHMTRRPI